MNKTACVNREKDGFKYRIKTAEGCGQLLYYAQFYAYGLWLTIDYDIIEGEYCFKTAYLDSGIGGPIAGHVMYRSCIPRVIYCHRVELGEVPSHVTPDPTYTPLEDFLEETEALNGGAV